MRLLPRWLTSPPYFAGKQYEEELEREGVPSSYLEYLELLTAVFAECVRKLEPGGRIAVNVANLGRKPYRSLSADVIRILEHDLGLLLRGELIWQKAEGAGGSVGRFARAMDAESELLGLRDSHWRNPHGLDAKGHYSSAYDLASMTWYAMHDDLFNQIVRQENYDAPGHKLKNLNKMLTRYVGAEGVKTGYTGRAGLCLVASATRDGKRVISVVLNDPKLYDESAALLDYGFARLAAAPVTMGEKLAIAGR